MMPRSQKGARREGPEESTGETQEQKLRFYLSVAAHLGNESAAKHLRLLEERDLDLTHLRIRNENGPR